ncbi:VapE domain-containing protein [Costertonia aggregata]|uniref:Virulence-associated E family protein n=1 Tax=Costertonia aggregata TaxID=343403 RepID=A0A7H9AMD7_9FLAO|nr:VapE domain-containing protein [Costertonia aggregata]QLG44587.1 virulence-associated E family protein [Costertonia aggregata]
MEYKKIIPKTKSENQHSGGSGTTIFHQVEDYIEEKYDLRLNIISLDIEISLKDQENWKICNEDSLFIELRKKNIAVPMNNLISILKSDFVPKYNPLKDYFNSLHKWDRSTDYIKKYASYISLAPGEDNEQFYYHFKKWCVRAVKCALLDGYFNKQAFILTDDGRGQNIGKSTWCRNLCPKQLSDYIAEDMGGSDKDSRLLLCKNFIINLDELAALARKEINQLKSQLSKDQINERLPYDRKNSVIQRVASFIGSTNKSTFLQDETGSVRWLCFVVNGINFAYSKEFNIDDLWSQAYSLSLDKTFDEVISKKDIEQNEIRNKKFQELTPEHDMLLKYFKKPDTPKSGEYMTSTDIVNYLIPNYTRLNLRPVNIGKALSKENFEKKKTGGSTFYYVEKSFC